MPNELYCDYPCNLLTQVDYDRLSAKAIIAIGHSQIDAMSDAQISLLNGSLDRILRSHGRVDTITDLELVGAYEMVVEHVLPSFLEAVFTKASERTA